MSSRLRGAVALVLASALCASCTGASEPTTTVTETATETATARAVTVTPSPGTSTVTDAPGPSPTSRTSTPTLTSGAPSSPAIGALDSLPTKGRAPKTGYDRSKFGQPWSDAVTVDGGHNGCDTRNDVLRRDLTGTTLDGSTGGCVVLRGSLQDPYTGTSLAFVRGPDTSRHVHIDHVVALSNAWQTGAQQLGEQQREDLANDPLNLLAVRGTANQQKGDGDAATWLPQRKEYRCDYAARQVAVKQRHDLWVTPPERDSLRRILKDCPAQSLPTAASTTVPSRDSS